MITTHTGVADMSVWLIASLGGQPQLVTFTLDHLLRQGEPIAEVWTLFPGGNPRYVMAHRRLQREFSQHAPYRERKIRYRARSLDAPNGRPLPDIRDSADADRVWQIVSALFAEAKRQGHRLHISLSGGRRALALMLFSVAMLYCTPNDRIWHIYTPPDVLIQVRDGARLHVAPEEGVQLIEIPFAPWGAYFPGIKDILGLRPQQARALLTQWPDEETSRRCAWVWNHLTPRQRDALRALVQHPTRRAAAQALGMEISTLDSHRDAILKTCRQAWPEEQVNLRFVREVFRGWLMEKGA